MRTIETNAVVTPDGKLTLNLQLPPEISAGEHKILVVIDEQPVEREEKPPLEFPVHDLGPWPQELSLRREDIYDESGR